VLKYQILIIVVIMRIVDIGLFVAGSCLVSPFSVCSAFFIRFYISQIFTQHWRDSE